MIPRLNEPELEQIIKSAAEAGASCADYILLRLPHELAPLFGDWLDTHYPGQKEAILNQLRDSRGGGLNSTAFGTRMRGEGTLPICWPSAFASSASALIWANAIFSSGWMGLSAPGAAVALLILPFTPSHITCTALAC